MMISAALPAVSLRGLASSEPASVSATLTSASSHGGVSSASRRPGCRSHASSPRGAADVLLGRASPRVSRLHTTNVSLRRRVPAGGRFSRFSRFSRFFRWRFGVGAVFDFESRGRSKMSSSSSTAMMERVRNSAPEVRSGSGGAASRSPPRPKSSRGSSESSVARQGRLQELGASSTGALEVVEFGSKCFAAPAGGSSSSSSPSEESCSTFAVVTEPLSLATETKNSGNSSAASWTPPSTSSWSWSRLDPPVSLSHDRGGKATNVLREADAPLLPFVLLHVTLEPAASAASPSSSGVDAAALLDLGNRISGSVK
ncbi:hypothetical protein EYF80_052612 [Liparis tanakae]|uniref:Uncharacterized protein n=1 Tax=Liparis tanakae TaxID=230148 RepID=A0A4Z2F891_9TELE|nr:hypothetical protein EYF80_052612 [Liparis tanakae]